MARVKIGTWIKADRVRIVKRNGKRTLEIRRVVKPKKRKRPSARRSRRRR